VFYVLRVELSIGIYICFPAAKYGLDEPPPEVAALISHATEERLKTLLEKLSVIAEHRLDVIKVKV